MPGQTKTPDLNTHSDPPPRGPRPEKERQNREMGSEAGGQRGGSLFLFLFFFFVCCLRWQEKLSVPDNKLQTTDGDTDGKVGSTRCLPLRKLRLIFTSGLNLRKISGGFFFSFLTLTTNCCDGGWTWWTVCSATQRNTQCFVPAHKWLKRTMAEFVSLLFWSNLLIQSDASLLLAWHLSDLSVLHNSVYRRRAERFLRICFILEVRRSLQAP